MGPVRLKTVAWLSIMVMALCGCATLDRVDASLLFQPPA